ncbi:cytochrome P450 oxidoreductase, putative [Paecilomyces variotii No. 5]|uniref:Cytochrome P450 oxidoreductase, putative n=1 Tax=Byssochlamys spectabilis (strain No. 5 / NBRC 109023) TaxID=1356009 RepID=V5GBZ4_BYSSN|nr:cytochrome P450 oxidoreductase, putative [Paecilomyces variotii No. 5]
MLNNKVSVITSPDLVSAVKRNHRTLSFDPIFSSAAERVAGIQGSALELLREKASGGKGLGNEVVHVMHPLLLGDGLDHMNERMITFLSESIDALASSPGREVDLFEWCRDAITVASTDAVYGPRNPYKSRTVQDAFWDVESNLSLLMVNIASWIAVRKAWKGRELLVQSFIRYYQEKGHENASPMAYARFKTQHDGGAALEDIARLESVMGLGILSNTVPTAFWVIFDIYSRPALLEAVRDEIRHGGLSVNPSGEHVLDLADIRNNCPLLLSSFQETLRLRSNSGQVRVVYEDTTLNDRWLLKKGSVLVVPAATINRNKPAWGSDVKEFDPWRFTKLAESADKRQKASAFLSFGISPSICPGRHFATGEILALIAMLILRFDISPVAGSWKEPKTNTKAVAASLSPPTESLGVTFSEREGSKGQKWTFKVTPGKGRFGLIIG